WSASPDWRSSWSRSWLLSFRALEERAQSIQTRFEHLPVSGHPCGFEVEAARSERARPDAPDLLRAHQSSRLEDPHVLLHARDGHVEGAREIADRGVRARQMLENPSSGGIRERRERRIEPIGIVNHVVQY